MLDRHTLILAAVIVLAVFGVLLVSHADYYPVWDEPAYVERTAAAEDWLRQVLNDPGRAFSAETIDRYFAYRDDIPDHPPLMRYVRTAFYVALRWLIPDRLMVYRLANMTLFALLCGGMFVFLARRFDTLTGLAAVIILVGMPRIFSLAHYATLETPIMFFTFLMTVAFINGIEKKRWAVAFGVVTALGLLVKLHCLLILPLLFIWAVIYRKKLRWNMAGLAAVPFVYILLRVWLWPDVTGRFWYYIAKTINRKAFLLDAGMPLPRIMYLGKAYWYSPPWHYPFVMIVVAIPVVFLLLFFYGVMTRRVQPARDIVALLVMLVGGPLILLAASQAPIGDGMRQLVLVCPPLACVAAIGLGRILGNRETKKKAALFIVLTLVPALCAIGPYYPQTLSYYSEIVGGLPGAARAGFEVTYWGDAFDRNVVNALADGVDESDTIWVAPLGAELLNYYTEGGTLKDYKLTALPAPGWQYLVLISRQGYFTPQFWMIYHHAETDARKELLGVPLVSIYTREAAVRAVKKYGHLVKEYDTQARDDQGRELFAQ